MGENHLNEAQQRAVEYVDGPLLIVAGAGTGKTTVITKKISHLLEKGIAQPENILALTFTEKAATEMQERVDTEIELGYTELQISTFHTFCQRLLEKFGFEIGLPKSFRLITDTDAWLLVRDHIYDFNLDYYRPLGNPNSNIHTLLDHFSKAKDELISAQNYVDHVEGLILDKDDAEVIEKNRLIEIANAYHTYNRLILENNALDFGDLIYYSVKLLKERPNILKAIQAQFTHVLVDEFQDVNYAQYELIRLLTQQSQLTVVGDDDQSIYSFRGSNVSIILRFKEDFPNATEVVLTENYRSGQEILDLAYRSIIFNNPDRLEAKLSIDKKLVAKGKVEKCVIEHIHSETLDAEVFAVIKKILELKKQHEETTWDDFAILVRANGHAQPFLNALETYGVPYEFLASGGLYRQPIVLDVLAFLRIVARQYEDDSWYRLMRLPCITVDPSDVQRLVSGAKRKSINYFDAINRAKEFYVTDASILHLDTLVSSVKKGIEAAKHEKPTAVLYDFLETVGYLTYLTHEEGKGNRQVVRQIQYLKQVFDLIRGYEEITPGASVHGFVEHFDFVLESGDQGKIFQPRETSESMNVMTIHASKGLEYKFVFMVNCVEERFPTRARSSGIELPPELIHEHLSDNADFHIEEERRLFYVGVTRAKEQLYFSSADYYGEDRKRKKKVSRFLDEIGFTGTHAGAESSADLTTYKKTPAPQNAEVVYDIPKKFSHSQIISFLKCPYQYKLAHVLKIQSKGTASFSFGNSVHATMQKFYTRVQELNQVTQVSLFDITSPSTEHTNGEIKVPTLEELYKMYEESWINDWYQDKQQREKYYEKGKEILKVFYTTQEGQWTIPVALEGWFKVKVGEYIINGRIDRIDKQADGSLEIIDYKTGNSKEKLDTDDKQQLLLYHIAAETLPEYRHIGPVGKLTFYYVNDGMRTSFEAAPKDVEKLKEKLETTIEKIREGKFVATPSQFVCKYCEFRNICEFRQ
ncbi:MAG: ATP-dependent helicase [Candidatus Magasanikbacteria bacterium]|nr:ATP-dependent helicase [Candidatus Magasanikbacteria bacterium]